LKKITYGGNKPVFVNMYLSNFQRLKKLTFNLLAHPKYIFPYLRYSLTNQTPLDINLPWWSFESIELIQPLLTRDKVIFEWGSGGSTLFLAKYAKHVTAIENNLQWVQKVKTKVNIDGLKNIKILHKEIRLSSPDEFLSSPYAKALIKEYDIVVIDGEDHFGHSSKWSAREECFEISQKFITKKGGIIIVDDSWRYPKILSMSHARKIIKCESAGPCRKGVTRTDIHIY
jgi:hypothetical protein